MVSADLVAWAICAIILKVHVGQGREVGRLYERNGI